MPRLTELIAKPIARNHAEVRDVVVALRTPYMGRIDPEPKGAPIELRADRQTEPHNGVIVFSTHVRLLHQPPVVQLPKPFGVLQSDQPERLLTDDHFASSLSDLREL